MFLTLLNQTFTHAHQFEPFCIAILLRCRLGWVKCLCLFLSCIWNSAHILINCCKISGLSCTVSYPCIRARNFVWFSNYVHTFAVKYKTSVVSVGLKQVPLWKLMSSEILRCAARQMRTNRYSVISQNLWIFINTAVRTRILTLPLSQLLAKFFTDKFLG